MTLFFILFQGMALGNGETKEAGTLPQFSKKYASILGDYNRAVEVLFRTCCVTTMQGTAD